jgi:2-keto-4-pentenoate hydratase/2-oxohepta-3-ene-1,7-dioic acid hydratase in catechol pathway
VKFLTARDDCGTHVYLGVPGGFVRLDDHADALTEPALKGHADVGALLRIGESVRDILERLADRIADSVAAVHPLDALDVAPPVLAPSKIVCVGHNYREHIAEGGAEVLEYPVLFSKFDNTLVGHEELVRYPPATHELDYEGELAVVIGRRTSYIQENAAMKVVAGFTILNDISARDLQHRVSQWLYGKSLDTFAPTGPFVATPDEVGPYTSLRVQTRVNGELRQDASCGDMIFNPSRLVSYISEGMTLESGDIIATGTSSGVGVGFKPPRYLNVGDTVEVSITGLGTLRSPIGEA